MFGKLIIYINLLYGCVSHKDWELPSLWIWFTEIDMESGLDFPIYSRPVMFCGEKVTT